MNITATDLLKIFFDWGWLVLPFLLFPIWKNLWLGYIKLQFALARKWVVFEIKIPQIVDKTPKSMEQLFAGIYAIKSGGNLIDKYIKGKHQDHISFEITGINGEVHFFIKTPEQYKNLITSQIHAQYPNAELVEAEDYAWNLPDNIPDKNYEIWGTELMLTKEDAYPIRTYKHFKEEIEISEKKFIDPISSLMEVLAQLKSGEQVWIHFMIRPADDAWQKEGKALLDKILGKGGAKKPSSTVPQEVLEFFYDLALAFFTPPPERKKKETLQETKKEELTPGAKDALAAIEESISKHGFYSNIRILYIAKKDIFSKSNIPAVLGSFNLFSTFHLNGFKPNKEVTPSVDYWFVKTREYMRKRDLYKNARLRLFLNKGFILNTEELATVYHLPSMVVEAPMLPKIGAKTAEPPAGLPTI